jgi:CheY-like chemotaxis protein
MTTPANLVPEAIFSNRLTSWQAAADQAASPQRRSSFQPPVMWYAQPNHYFSFVLDAWNDVFPSDEIFDFTSDSEVLQFLWNPIALKPRVVVLDVNTGDPSGLRLLQAIRMNPALSHLPVALVTSRSQLSCLEKEYAMGADWCFLRPEGPEQARLFVDAAFQHFQHGRLKHNWNDLAAC